MSFAGPTKDLSDAEFAELDELLAATPTPLQPLDAVMLDGYLCGVLVQPVFLLPAVWVIHVFDLDATPLPDAVDAAWLSRTTTLLMRRYSALRQSLERDGWFEPLILEFDEDQTHDPHELSLPQEAPDSFEGLLNPFSQTVMPWVAGFHHANACFPNLSELPDDAVMAAMVRIYRHLPCESAEERELVTILDRDYPLTTLGDVIEDLVQAVADLHDLTRTQRYNVETVKHEVPKVGRNDPCPCQSGMKFKICHGRAAV